MMDKIKIEQAYNCRPALQEFARLDVEDFDTVMLSVDMEERMGKIIEVNDKKEDELRESHGGTVKPSGDGQNTIISFEPPEDKKLPKAKQAAAKAKAIESLGKYIKERDVMRQKEVKFDFDKIPLSAFYIGPKEAENKQMRKGATGALIKAMLPLIDREK